jgi:hypothetical protein
MSKYSDLVLKDFPALFWPLNETSGTAITDLSGFDRHGKLYTEQAVDNSGHTLGVHSEVAGPDSCIRNDSAWSGSTQLFPGTGIRADDYQPYVSGSSRTFEMWCKKLDAISFATMFSSDAGTSPATLINGSQAFPRATITADDTSDFPNSGTDLIIDGVTGYVTYTGKTATTFTGCSGGTGTAADNANVGYGVGASHPTLEWGGLQSQQMVRWYARVDTFPVGWVDWGTTNTNNPRNDFKFKKWEHIVFTHDDSASTSELWVNGISQGIQTEGFAGTEITYTKLDSGNFQVGWRGDAPFSPDPGNTECWGGMMQNIAVYEEILSEQQIRRHYSAGRVMENSLRGGFDSENPRESISIALKDAL